MNLVIRLLALLAGAVVGLCVGYLPATYVACAWLWPQSNLCGLPVVITAAPLGAILGAIAGWKLSRQITL